MNKVEAILRINTPTTKKEIRSFLGLVGYYRRFIPHYSTLAAPLTDLLKKGQPKNITSLNPAQDHSYHTLQRCLTTQPVLKCPEFDLPFHLQTDASDVGLGAVLFQKDRDNVSHPVVFISCKLLPREQKYPIIERECLAIKWAIESLQYYLLGRYFLLYTDHAPLTWLSRYKDTNVRILRWFMELQPFSFQVCHLPGDLMGQADYLSWFPGPLGLEQPHSREGRCNQTSVNAGSSTATKAVLTYPRGTRESLGGMTSDAEGVSSTMKRDDGPANRGKRETEET
ncbi:hypothetical protein NDU88_007296 [Pleurodeles waltl]|uniref:Reverse transcriptase RNase H-like domain-containing protein n=1 Tax=Pleurodeles waltl TaxID=8319 RepID=A0AAV7NVW4_PLEWA|nr:hypothetical protein NDU88_007296 [Pleurodeles waltl]